MRNSTEVDILNFSENRFSFINQNNRKYRSENVYQSIKLAKLENKRFSVLFANDNCQK